MRRLTRRTLITMILLPAVLLAAAVYLVVDTVPSLPSAPLAPVLGMPEAAKEHYTPFSGPHPRLTQRPGEVFDFPIQPGETGPAEPLFAGARKYPFFCGEDRSREAAAQPLIDNDQGHGVPVFALDDGELDTDRVIGFSRDCQLPTHVTYHYLREGTNNFFPLEQADGDIATVTVDGRETEFVVRLETGTINRFIYAIAVLRGSGEAAQDPPSPEFWNQRLIYQFRGGIGIGRQQGNFSTRYVLEERLDELAQGYGIAFSTANATRNHFDVALAEDTAWRVKRQFSAMYGEPRHTIGIGSSGGAIQQYLMAQNAPGLLDGVIAVYSFPDMITQTTHVHDCELLEYFMGETDRGNPLWRDWESRSLLQGLAADNEAYNRFAPAQRAADFLTGRWNRLRGLRGSSECVSGWRGLTPLISNPHFVDTDLYYADEVLQQVDWTYWGDLAHIMGTDEHGYAHDSWDNTGVQYGLAALRSGDIDPETFLHLNASVGSWKRGNAMQAERFWFLTGPLFPVRLSFMSEQNMEQASGPDGIAARRQGHEPAMRAAWYSGQVFTGVADIPILDVRHYLDDELDMHHARASFSARARMIDAMGQAGNQAIWVAREPYDPRPEALQVMEQWLENRHGRPQASAATTRPDTAADRCMDETGHTLARGETVWDGAWNDRQTGDCMQQYPIHGTSRMVAGDDIRGSVFRCHLQSVDEALAGGVYGNVDMQEHRQRLQAIFPDGVCDYSRGDAARPPELLPALRATLPGVDN